MQMNILKCYCFDRTCRHIICALYCKIELSHMCDCMHSLSSIFVGPSSVSSINTQQWKFFEKKVLCTEQVQKIFILFFPKQCNLISI